MFLSVNKNHSTYQTLLARIIAVSLFAVTGTSSTITMTRVIPLLFVATIYLTVNKDEKFSLEVPRVQAETEVTLGVMCGNGTCW